MKSQVPDYVQLLFSLVQYIRKAIDNSPATMDVKKMATALLDDLAGQVEATVREGVEGVSRMDGQ